MPSLVSNHKGKIAISAVAMLCASIYYYFNTLKSQPTATTAQAQRQTPTTDTDPIVRPLTGNEHAFTKYTGARYGEFYEISSASRIIKYMQILWDKYTEITNAYISGKTIDDIKFSYNMTLYIHLAQALFNPKYPTQCAADQQYLANNPEKLQSKFKSMLNKNTQEDVLQEFIFCMHELTQQLIVRIENYRGTKQHRDAAIQRLNDVEELIRTLEDLRDNGQ